jgi:molecular chaperone IbpA
MIRPALHRAAGLLPLIAERAFFVAKIGSSPLNLPPSEQKLLGVRSKGLTAAGAANVWGASRHIAQLRGCVMTNYDLSPFYRSTVGFDRLFSMLDRVAGGEQNAATYPPYNIERTGENAYRITLAVAGFGESELSVETRENTLTVRGSKETVQKDEKRDMLYQGIAARAFERRFQLADHVVVTGAASENGLLHIDLVREVPEAQKPRTISINKGGAKTIEAVKTPSAQAA